jgi:hypothetical protein
VSHWPDISTAPAKARQLREHAVTLDDERTAQHMITAANMIDRLYALLVITEGGERQAVEDPE